MTTFVLPNFVEGDLTRQRGSRNPIEREIWNTLRELERIAQHETEDPPVHSHWTLGDEPIGIHAGWPLFGREITLPGLDHYDGDRSHL